MFIKNRKGQSILEYAILVLIVVAGIMAMQVWIKRGLQQRFRSNAEQIGEGDLFSPGKTTGSYTTVITSENKEKQTAGAINTTYTTGKNKTTVSGNETAPVSTSEDWTSTLQKSTN